MLYRSKTALIDDLEYLLGLRLIAPESIDERDLLDIVAYIEKQDKMLELFQRSREGAR